MPNSTAVFTTCRGSAYGSSLYLVTGDWVLRCSGNSNGRTPETFARKRAIIYVRPGQTFSGPALSLTPVEGGHTGNKISAVLNISGEIPEQAPESWNAHNGISWADARNEVLAAEAETQKPGVSDRFSRVVGQGSFKAD